MSKSTCVRSIGLMSFVALFLSSSSARADDAEGSNGSLCLGKEFQACLRPIDQARIAASRGQVLASSASLMAGSGGREESMAGGVNAGVDWNRHGLQRPFGQVGVGYGNMSMFVHGAFAWDATYMKVTTAKAKAVPVVQFFDLRGDTFVSWSTFSEEREVLDFITLSLKAHIQRRTIPDRIFTLPAGQYEKEVQLRVVSSQPISSQELSGTFVKATPHVFGSYTIGGLVRSETEIELPFAYSPDGLSASTGRFSETASVIVVDTWLEIGAAGRGQIALFRNAPVFLMPSVGGQFAMHSVHPGILVGDRAGAFSAQIGPEFAKVFFEMGAVRGTNDTTVVRGGGVEASFLHLFRVIASASGKPVTKLGPAGTSLGMLSLNPAFVIATNQQEGFVFSASMGGGF